MMTLYMHIFQGRYLFTNIASVIQIRQPQEQKTFRFDSQYEALVVTLITVTSTITSLLFSVVALLSSILATHTIFSRRRLCSNKVHPHLFITLLLFYNSFNALANEDTLLRTHCCRYKCFPVCPRAQHLLRTQILFPGHKKCF